MLLRYISATHERLGAKRVEKALTAAVGKDEEKVIMGFMEQLMEEGRVEGRVEGRARTLLELLAAKFGPVPAEARARVMAADEARLVRWSLRVLTETTLASVLDSAKAKPAKRAAPGGSTRGARGLEEALPTPGPPVRLYTRPGVARPLDQNAFLESISTVTGPSFSTNTVMSARKRPVSTRTPRARASATKRS